MISILNSLCYSNYKNLQDGFVDMHMKQACVDKRYLATTVLKTIDILNLLAVRPMTPTEICKALNLNKSTVHRLLYTLEYSGYIEKSQDMRNYRLGIKLVQLCSLRINDIELVTEAKPFLVKLVAEINQTVHLAVMSENRAMFIDKINTVNTIRMYSEIGKSIPLHCSAIGKSLLLDKSDEEILEIIQKTGMQRFTSDTLTEPDELLEQLRIARRKGFTIDNFEHEENVCCIAVPIYDYRHQIIAAISTAALKNTSLDREHMITALKSTAQQISSCLGCKCE